MCSEQLLKTITQNISAGVKTIFGDKLCGLFLYGSYARGEAYEDSDIDIFILAEISKGELAKYRKPAYRLASKVSLENDVVVSVTLFDCETFRQYQDSMPFLKNVIRDGVDLLAAV